MNRALWLGGVVGMLLQGTGVDLSGATLAREILNDRELPVVLQKARALLKGGLNAGSGYGEVWIRDLNTFIELALEGEARAGIREALLRFFKFQGADGNIVDGYIPRDRANVAYQYRRSPLAPEWLAHKNTVETDQEASLVQAIRKYVSATGDRSILAESVDGRTVLERLALALEYVHQHRFDARHGLVWGATTVDWGDVQPEHEWGVELDASSHRAIDVYDNAMFAIALEDFVGLPGVTVSEAERWRTVRLNLRKAVLEKLWDSVEKRFVPHLYLEGSPFPPDFDEHRIDYHGGTAVAIEAGFLGPDEIRAALERMRRNVRTAGASSIGLTVYPPYPTGYFKNRSMSAFGYQNGGDWCWFGGRMIRQLIRRGFVQEAYQELKPMVARVVRHGDFYEWWSLDNQPRGSAQFRGGAGVLGIAIEELTAWARRRTDVGQAAVPGNDARWPAFRGEDRSGVGQGGFPVVFNSETNLVWTTAVPAGRSSPCLWGDSLFLTAFGGGELLTLCYDSKDGTELWRRGLVPGTIEHGARLGSPATATPTTDGERVYVYFGSYGLAAYGMDGTECWTRPLPVPITQHGPGTSPVLVGNVLLLNCDQDVGSYLLALDSATGETRWKRERSGFRRGFSTPLPYPPVDPEQILVTGTLRLVSYNLRDGSERWSVRGFPNEMVSSPVAGGGLIYAGGWTPGSGVSRMPDFGGLIALGDADQDGELTRSEAPEGPARMHFSYIDADKNGRVTREEYETLARIFEDSKNALLAVRPDGTGDVTESHVVWEANRGLPYAPSPLWYEGRLYLVKNGGLASCYEAATGRVLYREERLGSVGDYYASPVASDGLVCAISQSGTAVVYRAGDRLEVVARNQLGESVVATPAIAGGRIYLRTETKLQVFGKP